MEKFKGTPGPWEFDKSSGKVKSDTLDCVVDVCSSSVSPYDLELDDNNGFLIAAAPDLLEALQEVLFSYESLIESDYNVTFNEDEDCVKARAAIARALGKNDGDE